MAVCKHCGAPIEYRLTVAGRRMPVNPERIAVLTTRGLVRHGWVSHFCTCRRKKLPRETDVVQKQFVPI